MIVGRVDPVRATSSKIKSYETHFFVEVIAMYKHWVLAVLIAASVLSSHPARGEIFLNSDNATLTLDPTSDSPITSWTVDGVEQLYHHWWWLATDSNSPISLNFLDLTDELLESSRLTWSYQDFDSTFDAVVTVDLHGGPTGSRVSTINQTLSITNRTSDPLSLRLFALSDFDLGGVSDPNRVGFLTSQQAVQTGPDGWRIDETVSLAPDAYAAGWAPTIYDAITFDGLLSTDAGTYEGDVEFGFQWDLVVAAEGSIVLSRSVSTVPEPASIVLMATMAGLGSLMFSRSRRRPHQLASLQDTE
jgi:hypothetical protein